MAWTVVTGAAGFIGGHVVEALLAGGAEVVGVDRDPLPAHLRGRDRMEWVREDLTDGGAPMAHALGAADAVLHLAGCPGVRGVAPALEQARRRDNVDATAAVLSATPPGTPLVVTSSASVYGGSRSARPCVESDRTAPRGGYAVSKVCAERLCAQRLEHGGAVLVTRPFTVAGERQRPDMALSRWIDAARRGRSLRLFGSRERTRDLTDVRQVAAALVALAGCRGTGSVNVGTGAAYTLDELADAVCAAVGRYLPRLVEPAAAAEVRHTLADTRRLRRLIGWTPTTDLAALVARQVAAQPVPSALDPELAETVPA